MATVKVVDGFVRGDIISDCWIVAGKVYSSMEAAVEAVAMAGMPKHIATSYVESLPVYTNIDYINLLKTLNPTISTNDIIGVTAMTTDTEEFIKNTNSEVNEEAGVEPMPNDQEEPQNRATPEQEIEEESEEDVNADTGENTDDEDALIQAMYDEEDK